jgi:hypothetical protein
MIWDYGEVRWSGQHHGDHLEYLEGYDVWPFASRLLHTNQMVKVEYRGPSWHSYATPDFSFREGNMGDDSHFADVSMWHQDGGSNPYFGVWATNAPTEVLLPDGRVYRPEPYHLIFIENRTVKHRMGHDGYNPSTREFCRIHVEADGYNEDYSYSNYRNYNFFEPVWWKPDDRYLIPELRGRWWA